MPIDESYTTRYVDWINGGKVALDYDSTTGITYVWPVYEIDAISCLSGRLPYAD